MTAKVNIEALRAKHTDAMAKAIAIAERHNAILDAWPDNLPEPSKISEHTAYADAFVEINVETLNDALALAEKCNPLHTVRYHDGCLSFRPYERLPEKAQCPEGEAGSLRTTGWTTIAPYIYHIDQIVAGHKVEHELRWWFYLKEYTIEARAVIEKPEITGHVRPVYERDRIVDYRRDVDDRTGHFTNMDRFWNSDPKALGHFVLWSM